MDFVSVGSVDPSEHPECAQLISRIQELPERRFEEGKVLGNEWTFWLLQPQFEDAPVIELGGFYTTKGFATLWDTLNISEFPRGMICAMFRKGIRPVVEDKFNKVGGKLQASTLPSERATLFSTLILSIISGEIKHDCKFNTVSGIMLHAMEDGRNDSIQIWDDGGFLASEPGKASTIETSFTTFQEQVSEKLSAAAITAVPEFEYSAHVRKTQEPSLFRPRRTAATVMEESFVPKAKNRLILGSLPREPEAIRDHRKERETAEQERTGPQLQKENGHAKPSPAEVRNIWLEKKEAEERAKKESAKIRALINELEELYKQLVKVSKGVDDLRNRKKQLEEGEIDMSNNTSQFHGESLLASSWADDVDSHVLTAMETTLNMRRRMDEVAVRGTSADLEALKEELLTLKDEQFEEGRQLREVVVDLLTLQKEEQQRREREAELERRRAIERENQRIRAAHCGLSSLVFASRVAKERKVLDEEPTPAVASSTPPSTASPSESKPEKQKKVDTSKKVQWATEATPAPVSSSAAPAPAPPAPAPVVNSLLEEEPVPKPMTKKRGKAIEQDVLPDTSVDTNQRIMLERLREQQQQEAEKLRRKQEKKEEEKARRLLKARGKCEEKEEAERAKLEEEFEQGIVYIEERIAANLEAMAAEEQRKIHRAKMEQYGELLAFNTDEERERRQIILMEGCEFRDTKYLYQQEGKALVEKKRREEEAAQRKEEAERRRREEKEKERKREEERKKRQEERIQRIQAELQAPKSSLVDKCKPTVFSVLAEKNIDPDALMAKSKNKKKPKQSAPQQKQQSSDEENKENTQGQEGVEGETTANGGGAKVDVKKKEPKKKEEKKAKTEKPKEAISELRASSPPRAAAAKKKGGKASQRKHEQKMLDRQFLEQLLQDRAEQAEIPEAGWQRFAALAEKKMDEIIKDKSQLTMYGMGFALLVLSSLYFNLA